MPVLLTVPDAGLEALLASSAALDRMWPTASREAKMLVHIVRVAAPTLADAVASGIVTLHTRPSRAQQAGIVLSHKRAVMTGIARDRAGAFVDDPRRRAGEIVWLEVSDVAVAGVSALQAAG